MGQWAWEARLDLVGGSAGPRGQRSLDQGCQMKGVAKDTYLLTSLAWPTQDISPEECVYIHDPTGLNVLKKGCARYCNQTILVSLGMRHLVSGNLGYLLSPGAPRLGLGGLPSSGSWAVS